MKRLTVEYYRTRERKQETFYSLVDAVHFMRDKERQGYSTLLV